jgi:hypothetical protein
MTVEALTLLFKKKIKRQKNEHEPAARTAVAKSGVSTYGREPRGTLGFHGNSPQHSGPIRFFFIMTSITVRCPQACRGSISIELLSNTLVPPRAQFLSAAVGGSDDEAHNHPSLRSQSILTRSNETQVCGPQPSLNHVDW